MQPVEILLWCEARERLRVDGRRRQQVLEAVLSGCHGLLFSVFGPQGGFSVAD
jgi:hypothetical protein